MHREGTHFDSVFVIQPLPMGGEPGQGGEIYLRRIPQALLIRLAVGIENSHGAIARCGGGLQGIEGVLRHQALPGRHALGRQVINIRPVLADAQLTGGENGPEIRQKAQPLQGPGHMGPGTGGGGGDGYAPVL